MDAEPSPPYQRDESAAQRLDRNWNELLQEIRVLQTGSQILAAFLIVLPFQSRFEELDAFQTGWYLGLLLLGLVIVAVLLTPVGMHRRLFRRRVKDDMVRVANRLLRAAIGMLGLLLVGVAVFVVDVVLNRPAGLVAGTALAALMLVLLVLVPWRVGRSSGGARPGCPSRPTVRAECLGRRSGLSVSADGQGPAGNSMSTLRCSVAPSAAASRAAAASVKGTIRVRSGLTSTTSRSSRSMRVSKTPALLRDPKTFSSFLISTDWLKVTSRVPLPISTRRAPTAQASMALVKETGRPVASHTTSNPSPAVAASTAPATLSELRSTVPCAPRVVASSSREATTSAIQTSAPRVIADSIVSSPMAPAPITRTRSPAPTSARVTT